MAGERESPRAGAALSGGGVGGGGAATRRLAAQRAREGVGRRGVLRSGAGGRFVTAAEQPGGGRRGVGSRRAVAAGRRAGNRAGEGAIDLFAAAAGGSGAPRPIPVVRRFAAEGRRPLRTPRRGVAFPLATAAGRGAGNRSGEGAVAPFAAAGGSGAPRPIPVVRRFPAGGRRPLRTRRPGVVFPLAAAAGRRAGNRTGARSVALFATVPGGSGARRRIPVVRRFAAEGRRPLRARRPGGIVPFLAAAGALAVAGCSPEAPGAGPAGEATRGAEGAAAATATETGIAAETLSGDGRGASSLPRPELHPGMPGVLNEAEIAALGAARERALGEIAHLPEFGFGAAAGPERIAAWDIDIGPEGEGLPAGRGSVERGETLYRLQCVQCHGLRGEGADYEALAGRVPGDGFPFAEQWRFPITVGSYWPYATTLFDYIRRAMPQAAPGTLPPDDVYALTAYVLHLNDLLEPGETLDADSLPRIVMPARDRFVRDDRRGGPEVR